MNVTRTLLLIPACAALLLSSGCKTRGDHSLSNEERQAENARLSAELENLNSENAKLADDLAKARDQLVKMKEEGGSMGAQLNDLLKGGDIAGVYATESGGVALSEDFSFAKGSADLNADGEKAIRQLAERLNTGENANTKIVVEGHTDDTKVERAATKEKYIDNWGLSAARAAAVVRALEAANVSPQRLHGSFRGEHAPRNTTGDKSKNRRVELYLR